LLRKEQSSKNTQKRIVHTSTKNILGFEYIFYLIATANSKHL